MSGSGPAGELTYADVRARLATVAARIAASDSTHELEAAAVEGARQPPGDTAADAGG